MSILISMLLFAFLIGTVMAIHEFGHFIVAKKNDVLVYEFSIGMGPSIYQKKKGETLYSLRLLPFGAYVALAGEDVLATLPVKGTQVAVNLKNNEVVEIYKVFNDLTYGDIDGVAKECKKKYDVIGVYENGDLTDKNKQGMYITISGSSFKVSKEATVQYKDKMFQVAPYERCFDSKSKKARAATLFAGPFFNIILASILCFIIYLGTGTPDYSDMSSMELTSEYSRSLFQEDDEIIAVNGIEVNNWYDYSSAIYKNISDDDTNTPILDEFTYTVLRDGSEIDIQVVPTMYFSSIGFASDNRVTDKLVIGVSNSELENNGLKVGTEILEINNEPVSTWSEFAGYMEEIGQKTDSGCGTGDIYVELLVSNNGREERVVQKTYSDCVLEDLGADEFGYSFGISPESKIVFSDLLLSPFRGTKNLLSSAVSQIKILFTSNELGVSDMVGPIGLFAMTSDIAKNGIITYLTFMAFLSVSIGIMNLLPLPILDGGRITFIGYEAVFGKPVKKEVEDTIMTVTVLFFLALTIYILFNDFFRFF